MEETRYHGFNPAREADPVATKERGVNVIYRDGFQSQPGLVQPFTVEIVHEIAEVCKGFISPTFLCYSSRTCGQSHGSLRAYQQYKRP